MSQAGILDVEASNPQIPTTFNTNTTPAVPIANVLNILGTAGITTSGAGNTVTISGSATIPLSFPTDSVTAIPADNILNLRGNNIALNNTGIDVTGSGNTVSIHMSSGYTLSDFIFQNSVPATPRTLTVHNADNDPASNAIIKVTVPGTSAADPFFQVGIAATMVYGFGIDNSDNDTFKIAANPNSNSATPSGGTILATLTSGGVLTLTQAPLGETSGGTDQNSYATGDILYASGVNTLAKRTIGTAGQVLTVSGGVPTWSQVNLTNGVTGILPIANGGTNVASFGTSTGIVKYDGTSLVSSTTAKIDASNRMTNSSQPLVFAFINAAVANATGDNTTVTIIFDQANANQGSAYNTATGVFTCPVAGNYFITTSLTYNNLDASFALADLTILCSTGGIALKNTMAPGKLFNSNNSFTHSTSGIVPMAAGGTIRIQTVVQGGTKTVGFGGNNLGLFSYLGITLLPA